MDKQASEIIDAITLAKRWNLPKRWIEDQSRSRITNDPIPCLRFGRYVRYAWGSPDLQEWLDRRKNRR